MVADPLAASVGQRVRALREARGLTLEKLAFESGLSSKGHLSDLEHGRLMPTVATLRTLAERLGVELMDLVVFPETSVRHRLVAKTLGVPERRLEKLLAELDSIAAPARSGSKPSRPAPVTVIHSKRGPRGAVPFMELEAAAGAMRAGKSVRSESWVKVDAAARALPGAFVARVVGKSMEPRVPDGALCLFRRPAPGNRQGRVFLVQVQSAGSPDDGGSYLLKLVERHGDGNNEHVLLRSLNPAFAPLRVDPQRQRVDVVAELVRVL